MIDPGMYIKINNERDELVDRLFRLDKFIMEHKETEVEHFDLLYAQAEVMNAYLRILDRRIELWEVERNEI